MKERYDVRIYEFDVLERREWALPVVKDDYHVFDQFDGTPKDSGWTPVRMKLVNADDGPVCLPSDMPWFRTGAPVLKQRAVDALGQVLTRDGELLPLDCDETDLWVFNVTTILDALDPDRSDVVRFSSGRIMDIRSYVFRPDRLRDVSAFKIPQKRSLFVTDDVVARAANLTGIGFKMLWEGAVQAV